MSAMRFIAQRVKSLSIKSKAFVIGESMLFKPPVAILHKAKKMGPMFDMLEKQGYTKFAQFKDGELTIK